MKQIGIQKKKCIISVWLGSFDDVLFLIFVLRYESTLNKRERSTCNTMITGQDCLTQGHKNIFMVMFGVSCKGNES